jgi:hypothetical protein
MHFLNKERFQQLLRGYNFKLGVIEMRWPKVVSAECSGKHSSPVLGINDVRMISYKIHEGSQSRKSLEELCRIANECPLDFQTLQAGIFVRYRSIAGVGGH